MFKAKQFYLDYLKSGPKRHDHVARLIKARFDISAVAVRDALLESGHIKQTGSVVRNDGKKIYVYELTGKKLKGANDSYKPKPDNWDDGTPKSKGNAFDWQNFANGVYTQRELASVEQGRKWGVSTAHKQILPRVSI